MRLLALETSTEYCSVALWQNGNVDIRETWADHRHSELLLGMVDELLCSHGLRVAQLDGIAFGRGPGSFTGLRIACGAAQGIAFAADLPVVGIDTLLAMAQASGKTRVVCCMDARMREIYYAAYEKSAAGWRTVCAPGVWSPGEVPLPATGEWHGCGSGFAAYREALVHHFDWRLSSICDDVHPRASEIAVLAAPLFAAGEGIDAALATPVYVRNKVALRSDER